MGKEMRGFESLLGVLNTILKLGHVWVCGGKNIRNLWCKGELFTNPW
jgi:hypothetical protein